MNSLGNPNSLGLGLGLTPAPTVYSPSTALFAGADDFVMLENDSENDEAEVVDGDEFVLLSQPDRKRDAEINAEAETKGESETKRTAEHASPAPASQPEPGFLGTCLNYVRWGGTVALQKASDLGTYGMETRLGKAAVSVAEVAVEKASAVVAYGKETRVGKAAIVVAGGAVSVGEYAIGKGKDGALWACDLVGKTAIAVAVRNAGVKDEEYRQMLRDLTRSDDLADAMEAAAPAVSRGIIYALEAAANSSKEIPEGRIEWAKAKTTDGLNYIASVFVGCDKVSLGKFIKSCMLRAMANIMQGTHDVNHPYRPPVLKLLNWLSTNADPGFAENLSAIFRGNLDQKAQLNALTALLTDSDSSPRMATKIFNLAFPDGDLGLACGANLGLAKGLKSLLPGLFASLIQNHVFIKSAPTEEENKESESKIEREEKGRAEGGHEAGVKSEHDKIEKELSKALYNPELFAEEVRLSNMNPLAKESAIAARKAQEAYEEGRAILWRESGVTDKVKHLEKVFNISSEAILKLAKEFLGKDNHAAELMKVLHEQYAINPVFNNWLGQQIKLLANDRDPLAQAIWTNAQGYLAEVLFTVAANVIDKVVGEIGPEGHRESAIFSRVLIHLASNFKDHGSKGSFRDLSSGLLQLAEGNSAERHPLQALPIAPKFRDLLWNSLKTEVLPKVLFPYLQQWFSQKDIPLLSEELDGLFLGGENPCDMFLGDDGFSSHPTQACHVLGEFVGEFIPKYLNEESESVAEMLMELDLVKAGLINLNPLEKQNLQDFIKNMLVQMGTSEDPNIKHLFKQAGKYAQAATMNVFSQAVQKIDLIEKNQPKFLLSSVVNVLKIMEKHLDRVRLNSDVLGTGGALHPGVNLDPSLSEEERIKIEMNGFYVPFTAKLLKFAGVRKATDLSIPTQLFEQLKGEHGPELLRKMLDKIMDSHTLNKMMLQMIEPLNNVVEGLAAKNAEELEKAAEEDESDRALNEVCGNTIKALVKMLPGMVTKVFFKIEAVKTLSAAAIGKYVRDTIGSTTIIEMISELSKGLTKERMSAVEEIVTEEEKLKTENELKLAGVKLVCQKIDEVTRNFFTTQWRRFQKWLDGVFTKVFGEKGPAIKKVLDAIFGTIFFALIGTVLSFIWEITFYKLFNYIIKAYLTSRSGEVLKLVHLDAHKSAVFHILDSLMNDLEKGANVPAVKEKFALNQMGRAIDHNRKGDPKAERNAMIATLPKRLKAPAV